MCAPHAPVPTRLKQTGPGSGVLGRGKLINSLKENTVCLLEGACQPLIHSHTFSVICWKTTGSMSLLVNSSEGLLEK